MKPTRFLSVLTAALAVTLISGCGASRRATTLQVGSFNIRYENRGDSLRGNGWGQRCPVITQLILFHDFQIFGTQEGKINQLEQMKAQLPGYDYIGLGRDDGVHKGEHSAIFYNTGLFDLLDHGDFWLSQTPEIPSVGWDAAMNRICTWGHFKSKETKQDFYYFSLHMDLQLLSL